jgi:hypothetical protein
MELACVYAFDLREALLADVRDCLSMPVNEQRFLRNLCFGLKLFYAAEGNVENSVFKSHAENLINRLRHYTSTQQVTLDGQKGLTTFGYMAAYIADYIKKEGCKRVA